MTPIALRYGILSGVIVTVLMILSSIVFAQSTSFTNMEIVGYLTMIVALSTVFFGIRKYRDQVRMGSIGFGQALMLGLYISLVGSVIYVIAWKIYSAIALPDFMDTYTSQSIDAIRKSGASPKQILTQVQEVTKMRELYRNPIFEFAMTFLEIFPVGVLVSLISAAVLRRKNTNTTVVTAQ